MIDFSFAHLNVKFMLDGKIYDVEDFRIKFSQPVDYKGQPQHETKGGELMIGLTQIADRNLYQWAKESTLLKDGEVVFQTDLGITVLKVKFSNGYCTTLSRNINAKTGTKTTLAISSENVMMNEVEHDNFWPK